MTTTSPKALITSLLIASGGAFIQYLRQKKDNNEQTITTSNQYRKPEASQRATQHGHRRSQPELAIQTRIRLQKTQRAFTERYNNSNE